MCEEIVKCAHYYLVRVVLLTLSMTDERTTKPVGLKSTPGKVHFSFSGRQGSVRVATELLAGKAARHAPPSPVVAGRHRGRGLMFSPSPPPTCSVSSFSRAEERSGPVRASAAPPPCISSPHGAVGGGEKVEGYAGPPLVAPSTKGGSKINVTAEGSRLGAQAPLMPAAYSSDCHKNPAVSAVIGGTRSPTPGPSTGLPICTQGSYIADPVGAPSMFPVLPGSNSGQTGFPAMANSTASYGAWSCGPVGPPFTSANSLPSAGVGAGSLFVPRGAGSAQRAYTVPSTTFSRPPSASSAVSANGWGPQMYDPVGSGGQFAWPPFFGSPWNFFPFNPFNAGLQGGVTTSAVSAGSATLTTSTSTALSGSVAPVASAPSAPIASASVSHVKRRRSVGGFDSVSDSDSIDDVESRSESDVRDETTEEPEASFQRASSRLQGMVGAMRSFEIFSPELFADPSVEDRDRCLSGVERFLGCRTKENKLMLLESPVISDSLAAASLRVHDVALASKTSSHRFVATVHSVPRRSKGVGLLRASLPRDNLRVSGLSRLLSSNPAGKQTAAEIPDRALKTLEVQTLYALETLSFADSLLTGLGKILFPHNSADHDGTNIPQVGNFDDEASSEALFLNVSALGRCSSALADSLTDSYANIVLLRRDAVLAKSVVPPESHARFRALPLHNSDLFGPEVKDLLRDVSDSARDSAFLRLPAHKTSQPGRSLDTKRHRGGRQKANKSFFPNHSAPAPMRGRFSSGGRGKSDGPSL